MTAMGLPRIWHALVRSAVLNVIGIVRIAKLTHTRNADQER
jgi:hypothetical protein